ncbi:MAG: CoA transferase [Acidobacteriota bacterium]
MLPLSGILVADFSRVLAGPLCTMMLADRGARVIKVEEPQRGDETRRWGPPFAGTESAYFLSVNRNKESLGLNLRSGEGQDVARRLIERADVVVENFLPRQLASLGLSVDRMRAINPRAVICSIRGFERGSLDEDVPGYDLLAQAACGLMAITGEPDGVHSKIGVALADVLTAHFACSAILGALYARERSGLGEHVEVSLQGATVASLVNVAQGFLLTGVEPQRYGNAHASIVPYQSFHATDGLFVVGAGTDRHFARLCRDVLEREELASDERFRLNEDRVDNRQALVEILEGIFACGSREHWVERCRLASVPAAVVKDFHGVMEAAGPLLMTIEHPHIGPYRSVNDPVLHGGARPRDAGAPPVLGQHSTEILQWLGYAPAELNGLRSRGVTSSED